jgi:hypothetical protein
MWYFDGTAWSEYRALPVTSLPVASAPIPQSRSAAIAIRLMVWLAFSVVGGALPLILDALKSGMSPHGLNFDDVLGHRGLFILSAVIAGGSFGELFAAFLGRDFSGKSTPFKLVAIFAGVATLLMVAVNTGGYMMIDAVPRTVRDFSEWFFVLTLLSTAAIIGMVATP